MQTVPAQFLPGISTVGRTVESAPWSAARKKPGLPARLPERREKCIRIVRIENDLDAAGVFVFAQNFCPGFATVGRAKNSALLIWTERVPERCHKSDVRIFR